MKSQGETRYTVTIIPKRTIRYHSRFTRPLRRLIIDSLRKGHQISDLHITKPYEKTAKANERKQ